MGAGDSAEILRCPDTAVPGGSTRNEQRRLGLGGEEAHWWGGHLFTPAKISDFKAQPAAHWEYSWLSRAVLHRCSEKARQRECPRSWGWSCVMQLECGFGCSGSRAGPGEKAVPCKLGPHRRRSWQHHGAELLRGCVYKVQLLKTGDLLRSTIQYLPLLQLFYI